MMNEKYGIFSRLVRYLYVFPLLWLGCTEKAEEPFSITQKYAPSALREDFQQVVRVVKKNHPALYDFTSKPAYDQLVAQQYKKITDSLPVIGFYQLILPLITKIGCGHSYLSFPTAFWEDSATVVFPLTLFFDAGRGYMAYSTDTRLKAGTEILSINNIPISALLRQVSEYVPTDGDNASTKKDVLNSSGFNCLLSIQQGFPKVYTIRLGLPKKEQVVAIRIPALRAKTYFASRYPSDSALKFSVDPSSHSALLTIKSFGFYQQQTQFKQFIDHSFQQIQQAKVRHLILDVRGNSGGDPVCAAYLLTYLAREPIPYFANPYAEYPQLDKPLSVARPSFTGQLSVLINGHCFSTTGHLCALLKSHQRATFIGTETGGSYRCNDSSQLFRLIHTGLLVRLAQQTYTVAVTNLPRFNGVQPDYSIVPRLPDVLTGRDRALEFALNRGKPSRVTN